MNLADLPNAAAMASRLAQIKQIIAEGPTAGEFSVVTHGGSYVVTLSVNEWTIGLQQIANELTEALTALGVNVS